MAVTVKEVAARAGVSPGVVSRVLHNKSKSIRVSAATAERVRRAAEEIQYRPNRVGRALREQRTAMIGILHGAGEYCPRFDRGSRYFASLMDGIIAGAFLHGYSIALCPKLLGSDDPADAMTDGRFDGLVWYSNADLESNRDALIHCPVPIVAIHTRADDLDEKVPTVVCDNDDGIRIAVQHLCELGHERIAFAVDGDWLNSEAKARLAAYFSWMHAFGLEASDADVFRVHYDQPELDRFFAERNHTAVIGHHDGPAADVIAAAQERGLRVPEDLSVVGFDSTAYCREIRPTLTSVYQPLFSMGERAIDLLVQRINGESPAPIEVKFPCSLDVRESTTSKAEQVNLH